MQVHEDTFQLPSQRIFQLCEVGPSASLQGLAVAGGGMGSWAALVCAATVPKTLKQAGRPRGHTTTRIPPSSQQRFGVWPGGWHCWHPAAERKRSTEPGRQGWPNLPWARAQRGFSGREEGKTSARTPCQSCCTHWPGGPRRLCPRGLFGGAGVMAKNGIGAAVHKP